MRRTARILVAFVVGLVVLGVIMLTSTSSVRAADKFADALYYAKRQLAWIGLALILGIGLARFDYHLWRKAAPLMACTAVIALLLVFVQGIRCKVGGSYRWVRIAGLSFQPSEFAKIALVITLSAWMSAVGPRARELTHGFLYPAAIIGVMAGLVMLEPDFGTTLLLGTVGLLLMYVGGSRLTYLAVLAAAGLVGFSVAVLHDPVRMGRILAFLMPEKYPVTAYHLAQSKIAFIKGGVFGVGLGRSIQKQYYLPEAHTDFIFAIIGEERGLLATGTVLALFSGILACGLIITMRAPDVFGRLLGFGMTMLVTIQAAINIGVVTGCLPTKGLPLPFISYGGSSMLASVAAVSILYNIAQHCTTEPDDHTRVIKDRAHNI